MRGNQGLGRPPEEVPAPDHPEVENESLVATVLSEVRRQRGTTTIASVDSLIPHHGMGLTVRRLTSRYCAVESYLQCRPFVHVAIHTPIDKASQTQ